MSIVDVGFDLIPIVEGKVDAVDTMVEFFERIGVVEADANHVPQEHSKTGDADPVHSSPPASDDDALPKADHERVLIPEAPLRALIATAQRTYLDKPYHSFIHGFDVCQATLSLIYGLPHFTKLDHLCLLISALMHDMAHPGVNNDFLHKTNDPLVAKFGKESTLEKYHISRARQALAENETVLSLLTDGQKQYFFTVLEATIRATDMALHGDLVKEFEANISSGMFKQFPMPGDEKLFLMKMVLKCADVSNVGRCKPCTEYWTERVAEEFLQQGDAERAAGVAVTPLFDREKFKSQAHLVSGFIDFVAKRLFELATEVLPTATPFLDNITTNRKMWEERIQSTGSASTQSPAASRSIPYLFEGLTVVLGVLFALVVLRRNPEA